MADYTGFVALLAPQFADDPRLPAALQLAELEVSLSHCFRDKVVVLLAAHMMEMSDRAGAGGAVVSRSEGGLSISFAQGKATGLLADTSFGQEVARLNFLCYGLTARTAWLTDPLFNAI